MALTHRPIQHMRRIGGVQAAPPSTALAEGEIGLWSPAGSTAGSVLAYFRNDTEVRPLVTPLRQVETTGNQSITGEKTISVDDFKLTGGDPGDILSTDGAGDLEWIEPPTTAVSVNAPITGDGATTPLGLAVASAGDINAVTVTNNTNPVTPLGLRGELGAPASTLTIPSPNNTVVPAINALHSQLQGLAAGRRLGGSYDAAANLVRNPTAAGLAAGLVADAALPAMPNANLAGIFLLVSGFGPGSGQILGANLAPGDNIDSDGVTWTHLSLGLATISALGVNFAPPGATPGPAMVATDVQAAIEELNTAKLRTVLADGVSISGTGVTGSPLEIVSIDSGTY